MDDDREKHDGFGRLYRTELDAWTRARAPHFLDNVKTPRFDHPRSREAKVRAPVVDRLTSADPGFRQDFVRRVHERVEPWLWSECERLRCLPSQLVARWIAEMPDVEVIL